VLALFLAGPGTATAATNITFGVNPAVPTYGAAATFSGIVTPAGQAVDLIADTGSGWSILASTTSAAAATIAASSMTARSTRSRSPKEEPRLPASSPSAPRRGRSKADSG